MSKQEKRVATARRHWLSDGVPPSLTSPSLSRLERKKRLLACIDSSSGNTPGSNGINNDLPLNSSTAKSLQAQQQSHHHHHHNQHQRQQQQQQQQQQQHNLHQHHHHHHHHRFNNGPLNSASTLSPSISSPFKTSSSSSAAAAPVAMHQQSSHLLHSSKSSFSSSSSNMITNNHVAVTINNNNNNTNNNNSNKTPINTNDLRRYTSSSIKTSRSSSGGSSSSSHHHYHHHHGFNDGPLNTTSTTPSSSPFKTNQSLTTATPTTSHQPSTHQAKSFIHSNIATNHVATAANSSGGCTSGSSSKNPINTNDLRRITSLPAKATSGRNSSNKKEPASVIVPTSSLSTPPASSFIAPRISSVNAATGVSSAIGQSDKPKKTFSSLLPNSIYNKAGPGQKSSTLSSYTQLLNKSEDSRMIDIGSQSINSEVQDPRLNRNTGATTVTSNNEESLIFTRIHSSSDDQLNIDLVKVTSSELTQRMNKMKNPTTSLADSTTNKIDDHGSSEVSSSSDAELSRVLTSRISSVPKKPVMCLPLPKFACVSQASEQTVIKKPTPDRELTAVSSSNKLLINKTPLLSLTTRHHFSPSSLASFSITQPTATVTPMIDYSKFKIRKKTPPGSGLDHSTTVTTLTDTIPDEKQQEQNQDDEQQINDQKIELIRHEILNPTQARGLTEQLRVQIKQQESKRPTATITQAIRPFSQAQQSTVIPVIKSPVRKVLSPQSQQTTSSTVTKAIVPALTSPPITVTKSNVSAQFIQPTVASLATKTIVTAQQSPTITVTKSSTSAQLSPPITIIKTSVSRQPSPPITVTRSAVSSKQCPQPVIVTKSTTLKQSAPPITVIKSAAIEETSPSTTSAKPTALKQSSPSITVTKSTPSKQTLHTTLTKSTVPNQPSPPITVTKSPASKQSSPPITVTKSSASKQSSLPITVTKSVVSTPSPPRTVNKFIASTQPSSPISTTKSLASDSPSPPLTVKKSLVSTRTSPARRKNRIKAKSGFKAKSSFKSKGGFKNKGSFKAREKAKQRKSSLFAFDEEPIYLSMYDKVKARSSANQSHTMTILPVATSKDPPRKAQKRSTKLSTPTRKENSDTGSDSGSSTSDHCDESDDDGKERDEEEKKEIKEVVHKSPVRKTAIKVKKQVRRPRSDKRIMVKDFELPSIIHSSSNSTSSSLSSSSSTSSASSASSSSSSSSEDDEDAELTAIVAETAGRIGNEIDVIEAANSPQLSPPPSPVITDASFLMTPSESKPILDDHMATSSDSWSNLISQPIHIDLPNLQLRSNPNTPSPRKVSATELILTSPCLSNKASTPKCSPTEKVTCITAEVPTIDSRCETEQAISTLLMEMDTDATSEDVCRELSVDVNARSKSSSFSEAMSSSRRNSLSSFEDSSAIVNSDEVNKCAIKTPSPALSSPVAMEIDEKVQDDSSILIEKQPSNDLLATSASALAISNQSASTPHSLAAVLTPPKPVDAPLSSVVTTILSPVPNVLASPSPVSKAATAIPTSQKAIPAISPTLDTTTIHTSSPKVSKTSPVLQASVASLSPSQVAVSSPISTASQPNCFVPFEEPLSLEVSEPPPLAKKIDIFDLADLPLRQHPSERRPPLTPQQTPHVQTAIQGPKTPQLPLTPHNIALSPTKSPSQNNESITLTRKVSETHTGKHPPDELIGPDDARTDVKRIRRSRKKSLHIQVNTANAYSSDSSPHQRHNVAGQQSKMSPYDIFEFRDSDDDETTGKSKAVRTNLHIKPGEMGISSCSKSTTSPSSSANLLQTVSATPVSPSPGVVYGPLLPAYVSNNLLQTVDAAIIQPSEIACKTESSEIIDLAQKATTQAQVTDTKVTPVASDVPITSDRAEQELENQTTAEVVEGQVKLETQDVIISDGIQHQQQDRGYITELNQDGKLSLTIRKASNQPKDSNSESRVIAKAESQVANSEMESSLQVPAISGSNDGQITESRVPVAPVANVKPTRRSARLMQSATKDKKEPAAVEEQVAKEPHTAQINAQQALVPNEVASSALIENQPPSSSVPVKENPPQTGPNEALKESQPSVVSEITDNPPAKTRRYTRGKKLAAKQQQQANQQIVQQTQHQESVEQQPTQIHIQNSQHMQQQLSQTPQQALPPTQPQQPQDQAQQNHLPKQIPQVEQQQQNLQQSPVVEVKRPKRLTRLAAKTYGINDAVPAKEESEGSNTASDKCLSSTTSVIVAPPVSEQPALVVEPIPQVSSKPTNPLPFVIPSYLPPRKRLGWLWMQKLWLESRYLVVWTSRFTLKDKFAAVQMHLISGNNKMPSCSYRAMLDETGMPLPIQINQRMRLDPDQLEGVERKMANDEDHCVLLAVPVGRDQSEYLKQSTSLRVGFIDYLISKHAAGIVYVCQPGESQPSYIIHIFPSCTFVNDHILNRAPDLLSVIQNIDNLIVVITTA